MTEKSEWKALAFIFILLFLAAITFQIVSLSQSKDSKNICVPKVSGTFYPLNTSEKYVVYVLDLNNKMHQQLATDISKALNIINNQQLNGGVK
jgi:hypothetical protein